MKAGSRFVHRFGFWLMTLLLLPSLAWAQLDADQAEASLDYYLPTDVTYDSDIPTPESVLGYNVGEWHVRHDQLVDYVYALAEASDRVTITEYARTYEHRPLVLLTITSPENQQNIDQIREEHVKLTDPQQSGSLNVDEMPGVVWMGYSVHGDEPSGVNASMVVAYHLAAAQGSTIEDQLDNTVILMDVSINPDGMNRFAHWANTHKGKQLVTDPNSREHNQGWPSGRTNHYWFDLNRDWLLQQHPESKGRLEQFHLWKPNVLTDHHEMGTNSTFFFQPGIPSRTHPITPQRNQDLTGEIAEYHASKLNERKALYYSRESFDDYYYGKGSTYPDVNGSIGILFEQGSSRGHAQESIHGVVQFPFTIKNQIETSFSTLEAMQNMRVDLHKHMRKFYKEALDEADDDRTKAYVFGDQSDRARTYHLVDLMRRHQVQVYQLGETVSANGKQFNAGESFIIPTNQNQYKLIKAVFEKRTSFQDSLFYDVSSFNLMASFNMPYAELNRRDFDKDQLGSIVIDPVMPTGSLNTSNDTYAYLFEWDEYYAPRAVNRLMSAGVKVKVAAKPFTLDGRNYDYGTIMVSMGIQKEESDKIRSIMQTIANEDGIEIYGVDTGLTGQGIDLGSRTFEELEKPEVALLVGGGVSQYEAGEVWHLLDQRYGMAPSLIEVNRLNWMDLDRYNVIVMVNGGYGDLDEGTVEKMKRWLQDGNTLITTKYATRWAANNGLTNIEFKSEEESDEIPEMKRYVDLSNASGAQYIGGAIFNNTLDLTHPLGYGFNDPNMTVFRNSTLFMKPSKNAYASPLRYTNDPLFSGYISEENEAMLKGTAGIVVESVGSGKVINMVDNPNFRAFWYGTNKLFMNAIFFGQTISGSSASAY
ncbi:MAG: M14 metallopeptidase family protein [Bacteroidota bacterium]